MLGMDHLVLSFVARVISILLFVFCSRSTGGADQPKKFGGVPGGAQSEASAFPLVGVSEPTHRAPDSPRLKCTE